MNKVSFPISACLYLWAALLLPAPSLAQKSAPKPADPKPAASPPASEASLGLSPQKALAQKQMLADDTRLDRLISLDVISFPLDEVLQKQSVNGSADAKPSTDAKPGTDTKPDPDKLVLTASHNCEALKLQIRLNHRPLRTLMTALAEMLPGTWTRTKEGYNLSLTDKAAFARAEWWRLFLGEREKALAAQRQAVLAAMETKARRRQLDDPEPEPSDHAVEEEMANQHDFFHTLPQALKEQIAANMEETAFYEVEHVRYSSGGEQYGAVGWLSQMPPETQEKFKTAMQDYITNHLAAAPPAFQKYAAQAQNGLAAFDPSKVYFFFHNGGIAVDAQPFNGPPLLNTLLELHLPPIPSLSQSLLMLDQSRLADFVYGGGMTGLGWKKQADDLRKKGDAAPEEWKFIMYLVYGMGDAAPPEWKRLADYQRGRVWPNTLPALPPDHGHPFQIGISRAAQTDWLGERAGMEYVCDYYSHGGYTMPPEQRKQPLRRPLAAELDEMAAKRDISWKRNADGLVLIRDNRWYRDDDLEVPQPLLRRWFGRLLQARQQETAAQAATTAVPQTPEERAGAIKQTWDWAAEVSSTLTPWQIYNGLSLFQPEERGLAAQNDASAAKLFEPLKHQKQLGKMPQDFDFFTYMTRQPPFNDATSLSKYFSHTVHLYGSLDDAGRTALLGAGLSASTLSPSQLTEAAPLLPLLPQALQSYSPDAVLLRLPCVSSDSTQIRFGGVQTTGLELVTPPPDDPQNAP